jgi:methylated-DNA-[protein]-cysteine S-methyltransferase
VTEALHIERFNTPTGRMLIVTDDSDRLRAAGWVDFEDHVQRWLRRQCADSAIERRDARRVSTAKRALAAYFEGDLEAISSVPTMANGTDFQREVWAALRLIPVGFTTSYGALAAKLGRPAAVRAVGLANGANPIAVVVPCHRVIGANGSLTGYGGGLDRKRWLLAHESVGRPLLTQPDQALEM